MNKVSRKDRVTKSKELNETYEKNQSEEDKLVKKIYYMIGTKKQTKYILYFLIGVNVIFQGYGIVNTISQYK